MTIIDMHVFDDWGIASFEEFAAEQKARFV
jgi:hypothetical protein